MTMQPKKSRNHNRKINRFGIYRGIRELPGRIKNMKEINDEQLTYIGYLLLSLYMIMLIYRYLRAIIWLEPVVISNSPVLLIAFAGLPFGLWAYSTKFDNFNFHARKRLMLYVVTGNAIATAVQPAVYFANMLLVRKIMRISPGENMTKGMIVTLGRIAVLSSLAIAVLLIAVPVGHFLVSTQMKEKINVFRIMHHIDERKNKENRYDLKIIKDLETGKTRAVNENDRFVHMLVNGASGTGKTSST